MKTLILPSRFHEGNWCSSSVRCEAAGPDDVSSHAPRTCVGQLMPAFIHFLKCLFCGSCLLQNKHHIGNSHLHSIFIRLPLNTLWVVFGRKAWSFGFKYNSKFFYIMNNLWIMSGCCLLMLWNSRYSIQTGFSVYGGIWYAIRWTTGIQNGK